MGCTDGIYAIQSPSHPDPSHHITSCACAYLLVVCYKCVLYSIQYSYSERYFIAVFIPFGSHRPRPSPVGHSLQLVQYSAPTCQVITLIASSSPLLTFSLFSTTNQFTDLIMLNKNILSDLNRSENINHEKRHKNPE